MKPQKIVYEERKYQVETVNKIVDYVLAPKDKGPGIIVVPVGGGKSLIIAQAVMKLGMSAICIQPSEELLMQNYNKLIEFGGTATLYSASVGQKVISNLTFATLKSVIDVAEEFKAMGVQLVFIDECHKGIPPTPGSEFMRFITALAPKKVIGLTATPVFLKNSMEGAELKFLTRMRPVYFKQILHCVQIQELIADNFWSPLKYVVHPFDASSLKYNSNGSDFTEESVKKAAKQNGVNNKIYRRIKQLREEGYKKILVFVDCIENAEIMANAIGGAKCVHSKMKNKKERPLIIHTFKEGDLDVLVNVGVLTTGFDCPEIDAVLIGSATNSLSLYYQEIGRGVRKAIGKLECLIEDFMGNVERFGRVEDLEIINNSSHGWGIYNKDVLLTNVPMAGRKITKKELENKAKGKAVAFDGIIPFGKYKGQNIGDLPLWYLEFVTGGKCTINWNSNPIMRRIYQEIMRLLEIQKSMSLIQK